MTEFREMVLPEGFFYEGRQIVTTTETSRGAKIPIVVVSLTPDNHELFTNLIEGLLDMAFDRAVKSLLGKPRE